jgi:hypothetical protein
MRSAGTHILVGLFTQHAAYAVSAPVSFRVSGFYSRLFAVILFSTVVVAFLTVALVLPLLL